MFSSLKLKLKSDAPRTPTLGSRRSSNCGGEPVLCAGAKQTAADIASQDDTDVDYSIGDEKCAQKTAQVLLERDADGSLGFTLRGGRGADLIVTNVRPGGPAHREGSLWPGDRLLAVDGQGLQGASLSEAHSTLMRAGSAVSLSVEYDVALHHAAGPLRVQLTLAGRDLGLSLADCGRAVLISSVRPASLADRCGALHVGDQILTVGETHIEGSGMTASEVTKLLHGAILVIEIMPMPRVSCAGWQSRTGGLGSRNGLLPAISPCPSNFSTLNSRHRVRQYSRSLRQQNETNNHEAGPVSSGGCFGVCHAETVYLTLQADAHGYGLTVQETPAGDVIIAGVDNDSPADRCGCIQTGDRLLIINGRTVGGDQITVDAINEILEESCEGSLLSIQLEFDVADSVVPASGVFSVKLAKKGNGLGITITASKTRLPGDPLLISDIRRGSVAHRTGSLQPGDRLLAIDSISLEHYTLEETQNVLKNSADIVTLRIKKDETFTDVSDNKTVVYTVELVRHGGPLGITIAGSEEPFEPITISGLSIGGLAQQTGALHVGDRLLAINGESLRGKPLSEGIALLQNSGDTVTLKIARNVMRTPVLELQEDALLPGRQFSSALPSVDSAVESWDSSMRGNTPPQPLSDDYHGESSTVKRKHRNGINSENHISQWDGISQSSHSVDSGQSGVLSEEEKVQWDKNIDVELHQVTHHLTKKSSNESCSAIDSSLLARERVFSSIQQGEFVYSPRESPLPLPHYLRGTSTPADGNRYSNGCGLLDNSGYDTPQEVELYQVTLYKDPVYEDFGFSVSDGLYERGVYINRMRKSGPADLCGVLRPFDRILQVNSTQTHDFDCCLTVPLIASAGEKLELTVARSAEKSQMENKVLQWAQQDAEAGSSLDTVTKTL